MKLKSNQIIVNDHSLAKNMSRLLLTLQVNPLFRAVLDRNWISCIQIIYTEICGYEGREYFLNTGSLEDMIPHLANWLSLILMDGPSSNNLITKEAITERQVEALSKCQIASAVRAQYGKGFIAGEPVPGFLEEAGEQYHRTETFFAVKLLSNTEKWFGVPTYLISGKRVGQRKQTKVVIKFYPLSPLGATQITFDVVQNRVEIPFILKSSGGGFELESVLGKIDFEPSIDGHTRLLLDAMRGDRSLVSSADFGVETWRLITPIVQTWKEDTSSAIPQYEAGGELPTEAIALIRNDGHEWSF